MSLKTRIMNERGDTSREPDGNVGPYFFWLGDAFSSDVSDMRSEENADTGSRTEVRSLSGIAYYDDEPELPFADDVRS